MSYLLNNAAPQAKHRFAHLEALYDGVTTAQLGHHVAVEPGWRCWEVGCGSGSVAAFLGDRVGPTGEVFATDVDTRWVTLPARSLATVLTHDVATEDPPATDLNLVHLRLVASHLPDWPAVLPKLVAALAPGGWLVIEELDPLFGYQPHAQATDLVNVVGDAFTRVLASRGGNPHLGSALYGQLRDQGLVSLAAHGVVHTGTGGGNHVAELMRANVTQMAMELQAQGITPGQLVAYLDAMANPETVLCMPVFWTVRGQKLSLK